MTDAPFRIVPVRTPADLDAAIGLFRAYAASLDIDLAFQGFEAEMAALPGLYAPPAGDLLLARDAAGTADGTQGGTSDDAPLGCVALRPLDSPGCCEMKRLYVSPTSRGRGVGGRLVDTLIAVAERIGYREMRLDTIPSMARAQYLYRERGFAAIAPYYDSPVPGTLFMRRLLAPPSDPAAGPRVSRRRSTSNRPPAPG